MSGARDIFLKRLSVFNRTLNSEVLRDKGITPSPHNEKARLLRNGISIIAFTILEDFIKARAGELLENISTSGLAFGALSSELQQATTLGALRSITEIASNRKRANEDWLSFIQNETKHLASTSTSPYSLTKYALGWDKSNLAKEDITKFLKIFHVHGGWNSIQQVTALVNATLIRPETTFLNAAQQRHKAAHNPNANSLYTDLVDFARDVKSLSLAYDVLISIGINHLVAAKPQVTPAVIKFRYLIKESHLWKEYSSLTSTRPLRTDANYNRLFAKVIKRARGRKEVLVVKKNLVEIDKWYL